MESGDAKKIIIKSLFWKLLERGGTQGFQLITQIVLARLLLPEQFGVVAIVTVFINLAQVFVQSGFNTALIQKKNADDLDFSSTFYLSLLIALLLYICIFLTAPLLSVYYNEEILMPVIRILALILFPGALNTVQNAYISRNLMFKELFKSSLIAIIFSGLMGIILAYNGFGIWAIVIQQLTHHFLLTIVMWNTVKWRPQLLFSFVRVKTLFSFGGKILVSSLLNVLYIDIRTLIIGRMYQPSVLGFYNRGEQFPKLIVNNIDGSIQSVMLPTLSTFQDNKSTIKSMVRRSIITSSFLVFPLMMGLAAVAEPLIMVLLSEKWEASIPFLQIFSFTYILMPIHTANLQAINALGKSDVFLKLEIIKKIIGIAIVFISLPYGVFAIAIGQIVSNILSSFINAYPNKKLLNYGYLDQILDISPSLVISLIMGSIVYTLNYLQIEYFVKLVLQIIIGIVTYYGLATLTKNTSLIYLRNTIKEFRSK